jgi:hypothetical protein
MVAKQATVQKKSMARRKSADEDKAMVEFLLYLKNHTYKEAADYYAITVSSVKGRKFRIRKRIKRCQTFLNQVYSLSKNSERIRHLITSSEIPEKDREIREIEE